MAELEAEAVETPEAFEVPDAVAEAFRNGDLALFVGTGVGIDAAFGFTLAQDIVAELGLDPEEPMAFPDVMTAYEQKNGRMALLERIKERLDYVKSFPELEETASRFHRALSTAFTVNDIYTTDWDDFFERECGAIPFAAERDWAFWRLGGRKVFRIHGSVSSPASVIATDADYTQCYGKLDHSMVWEKLETMLSTKTVVFVGYSFRDTDFNAMCGAFAHRMEELLDRCSVVTMDQDEPSEIAGKMQLLRTDALTFVEKLKECYGEGGFLPDERYDAISDLREDASIERQHMLEQGDMREDGAMLLSAAYQDGLVHACQHIQANRRCGQYSSPGYTEGKIAMYRELQQSKREAKQYEDVAYIEGYIVGLGFLTAGEADREATPLYFVLDHEGPLTTFEQFRDAAGSADPEPAEYGRQLAAGLPAGETYRHSTFLF